MEFTSSFILKTALKSSPGTFMACSLCILLVAAGYSIRLIDNLMCVARPELNCNPITFWNAQWVRVPLSSPRPPAQPTLGGCSWLMLRPCLCCLPSLQMLVVTILTVGYGDFVPHSDGARTVAIIGGMTGTIITAITVALTTTYLNLSRSESKVHHATTQTNKRHPSVPCRCLLTHGNPPTGSHLSAKGPAEAAAAKGRSPSTAGVLPLLQH